MGRPGAARAIGVAQMDASGVVRNAEAPGRPVAGWPDVPRPNFPSDNARLCVRLRSLGIRPNAK
jgi:hypothetical protein